MCFELGRFPHELPRDLPDEQLILMWAYLSIKAEMQREADDGVGERARSSEAMRQSVEERAWAEHQARKAVSDV